MTCLYCDKDIIGEPFREPDDVSWRGERAKVFCDEDCSTNYAERAASN